MTEETTTSEPASDSKHFVMRDLATGHPPTEEGWYIWWELNNAAPYCVLAKVKEVENVFYVNFRPTDYDSDFIPVSAVADRLWLRVCDA